MAEPTERVASWSIDDLLDSDPLGDHSPRELSIVWTQLHHYLYVNDARVVSAFCAAVRRERRTSAKLVALRVAPEAAGELAELVDELIVDDQLLYAHYRGSKLMASAIEARWAHLDANQRAAVARNIEEIDVASPSFADTRALIAAIPARDRTLGLEARLSELGGPRAAENLEISASPREDDERGLAPRSLAEQMADVPGWLKADPIPWGRVSSALLEDERAQSVEATDRPTRLLTSDTAKRAADAALEAMVDLQRTTDVRDHVIHTADVALAFPPHHEDGAMNTRLVDALRSQLFAAPVDTEAAVHALMFIRPWHWHRDRGRALLLEILRNVDDSRVLAAALHQLWYAEEPTISQGLAFLTDAARTARSKNVARDMGQLLGAHAPWVASLADLLRTWLATPPTGRFLSSNAAWNEFLGGVGFALKNVAHRASELDPMLYAQLAAALWAAWQSPRSRSGEERHGLALFLMSPIHQTDRTETVAARYWPALRVLFEEILTTGDEEDVSGALFSFDLGALASNAIEELASILCAASIKRMPLAAPRDSRRRMAQVLRDIAMLDACTRMNASAIHQVLVTIGARKEALDVEQRWGARR